MGHISIVHGIIKLNDMESFQKVINEMKVDDNYPWIRAEMFNTQSIERPYYYDNPISTFGTTYKNLHGGVDWSQFILKFEYLLDKIDFDFARVRYETEFLGDFEFFWGKKWERLPDFYAREDLIEREKWFFGYGFRHMYGGLLTDEKPELPIDFEYPVKFNEGLKKLFNSMIDEFNQLPLNSKEYIENYLSHSFYGNDDSSLILTYLKLQDVIEYGWEYKKGFFIKRLREIKEVNSPYDSV
jgi:hypothetical protein